jgi:hypothetical protein
MTVTDHMSYNHCNTSYVRWKLLLNCIFALQVNTLSTFKDFHKIISSNVSSVPDQLRRWKQCIVRFIYPNRSVVVKLNWLIVVLLSYFELLVKCTVRHISTSFVTHNYSLNNIAEYLVTSWTSVAMLVERVDLYNPFITLDTTGMNSG